MKKIIYLFLIASVGFIVLESFKPLRVMRRDGTDPGYTGSPGDSGKNCTTCHGGTTNMVDGWITSTIPVTGYIPGQTYTITATNTSAGSTRFGFEVSPQKLNGDLMGTLIITDTARTQLVGNNKYVTYKSPGVDGVDFNTWTFDWIAPATGSGEVVFYGAFNSNPGHKSGDNTTLSTLRVYEHGTVGLKSWNDRVSNVAIFPNPGNDLVKVSFDLKSSSWVQMEITDLSGKKISTVSSGKMQGKVAKEINTSTLPEGVYFIRLTVDGKSQSHRMTILHK